jgi:hypothetical protein
MKVKVVSKDVGAEENGVKMWDVQKYSLMLLKLKLHEKYLWVRGSCWGRGINFKLVVKA